MADPVYPVMPLSQMLASVQTGDILLFHGGSDESTKIEAKLQTWFSHAAMAVIHPSGRPMIWQEGPDPIMPDPEEKTTHGGAQCGWLDDTLKDMASTSYNDAPHWRQLTGVQRGATFDTAVVAAVNQLEGTAFPSMDDMLKYYEEGLKGIPGPTNSLFCAELVATMYQEMKLLPAPLPPPNSYSPRNFANEGLVLPLLGGAALGPIYKIDVSR